MTSYERTPEIIEKMRCSMLGKNKRPHSDARRQLTSETTRGLSKTPEHCEKIRLGNLGKNTGPQTPEHVQHMIESLNRPEVKKKMREKGLERTDLRPGSLKFGYKSGTPPDLGFYIRSNLEANYARILKFTNTPFRYESNRFYIKDIHGNKIASYCPDFYLPATDSYVELKGWMKPRDAWKISMFRKQYPEIQLKVIMQDSPEWRTLTLKFHSIVPMFHLSVYEKKFIRQAQQKSKAA